MPLLPKAPKRVACRGGQRLRESPGSECGPVISASNPLFLKTKLCKFFAAGACSRGGECRFAHGQDNLTALPDFSKTQFCPSVVMYGACEAKDCAFAHSRAELRSRIDRPTPWRACEVAPGAAAPCRKGANSRLKAEQAARLAQEVEALIRGFQAAEAHQPGLQQGNGKSEDLGSPSTLGNRQTSAGEEPRLWNLSSDGQGSESDYSGEVGSDPLWRLEVRNTFLAIVVDEEACTLRRVKSAPMLTPCP